MNSERKRPAGPPSNRSKTFRFGIVAGRFQPLHLGHCDLIDTALRLCDRVGVMIGSCVGPQSADNPLSYSDRLCLLRQVYGDRIEVCPLPDIDIGVPDLWGKYLIKTAQLNFGKTPEVIFMGEEKERPRWFGKDSEILVLQIKKSRQISGSAVRAALLAERDDTLQDKMPEKILPACGYLKDKIRAASFPPV